MSSRWISAARNSRARLAAAALLFTAGSAAAQDFGRPADTLRYPYVAALSRGSAGQRVYFCAGTLIAPQWILTAAHCFYGTGGARITAADLWAEAGGAWLKEVPDAAQVRIQRIVIHPDYDAASQANDIALVRLESVAGPLVAEIGGGRPVMTATVLGFGSFYEGRLAAVATLRSGGPAAQASDRLRQADVRVVASEECARRLSGAGGALQICAGAGGAETCVGDSGGPLVVETPAGDRVAGLVSFGTGCAGDLPVTVYTRVPAYADWIARVLAGR
jgi:secreted trypsin-like serine protease